MFPGSIRIFVGDQHTVAVPEGHELIAARVVGGATVITPTVTAGPDGADFRPTELGRYYLRTRKDSTENYRNAGLLEVVPLANVDYEALCSELDAMNAAIRNEGNLTSFIQWMVETPDGTKVTRMTLGRALAHRAMLEARKIDYERQWSGRMPVRFN